MKQISHIHSWIFKIIQPRNFFIPIAASQLNNFEYSTENVWYLCDILHESVSHDHPLKTLLIAPITAHKHVLTSDGQKFPPWPEFLELRNFYISLIVFDV